MYGHNTYTNKDWINLLLKWGLDKMKSANRKFRFTCGVFHFSKVSICSLIVNSILSQEHSIKRTSYIEQGRGLTFLRASCKHWCSFWDLQIIKEMASFHEYSGSTISHFSQKDFLKKEKPTVILSLNFLYTNYSIHLSNDSWKNSFLGDSEGEREFKIFRKIGVRETYENPCNCYRNCRTSVFVQQQVSFP